MSFKTADLCDRHADTLQIGELPFRDFGGRVSFHGEIETVKAFEDNSQVRECVGRPGEGKVLVVDGGGSMRRAMLGDLLAAKAVSNGWMGILIYGCIRDSEAIGRMDLGVKALGTHPCKTEKRDLGDHNVEVRFAGVTFVPGHYLYADEDGVVVSASPLSMPE
ncbi:MAG: ribonuclease E activity regulator RraA [Candidatus Hydrogenedentes bacterium]|nr:ribonuclease E activity regulator RraA [Candidatus Hydrogenedentota bacterium]